MELLLDTANLKSIRDAVSTYPISGLTTNPSIISKENRSDFFGLIREIRDILGKERTLHVQVTRTDCEGILKEAEAIRKHVDEDVYIKTPVSKEGLKAIGIMAREGFNVTATAIYTTIQGELAAMAGAKYLALYYNRMLNLDIDADAVFRTTASAIAASGLDCKIVGASFKNIMQVTNVFADGAEAVTVPPELLDTALANPSIDLAVRNFNKDWEKVYGNKGIAQL
ncbi:MAG: fructose-6-phosphate aldolase [Spirochaetales bacterium]|nr:fructose-6-phosphate aldolase [Spirochaetales bacterium]MBO7349688.1 fructose-6-phosphate aldolase [Spirochaetales bacterium]